ncbi:MAG TPA: hypothetical protein ENJ75_00970 [Candidatus Kaiserbacteria bacterium]|nr:hypothetical protein [Candidatus Kaiserbacteria bacterium]
MNLKQRVFEILNRTHLMSLGICDEKGVWVADVIFVFDDELNVYWISYPDTRHSKSIRGKSVVAGSITATNNNKEPGLGIQFEGTAEKVDGELYEMAVKYNEKRGRDVPVKSKDFLGERSWYVLHPTKIRLIDEENFGFNTQDIEL